MTSRQHYIDVPLISTLDTADKNLTSRKLFREDSTQHMSNGTTKSGINTGTGLLGASLGSVNRNIMTNNFVGCSGCDKIDQLIQDLKTIFFY